ncbi:MAG: FecR domain-containing protein [Opitutaceae bacterium]|nr:FecR domain-containing protein [Opitutaceae bacterium]
MDWVAAQGAGESVFARVAARERRRRGRRAAFGAVAGLVVAAGAAWRWGPVQVSPGTAAPAPARHAAAGRQTLPDGSAVDLRHDAQILVAFEGIIRRVVLERGEAHFSVAKDPAKPFVVVAGGVAVRAIGTAFSVQFGATTVEVIVSEGRVAVEPAPPTSASAAMPPPAYAHLTAGHRVVVPLVAPPPLLPVETMNARDLAARLAWRVPRLEFAATPLADAVAALNRHTAVPLVLADPSLGTLELSGSIRADNTDSVLHLLAAEFGIRAERRTDAIVLRRNH